MKVAVTGGHGVLGRALSALRPDWVYLSRAECDVRNANATLAALNGDVTRRFDAVVHAAALTDHQHPNAAEVIETNIVGTRNVAVACRNLKLPLVYASTHYVYEGTRGNYSEAESAKPIGAYAWSKLAGEQWVRALVRRSLVVRGSWYTHETRLQRWAARGALTDAWCSREPVLDAARKIVALTETRAWLKHSIVNIGGARRTFTQILADEHYKDFPVLERWQLNTKRVAPYAFPADTSVDTSRFEALKLAWHAI